MYQIAQLLDAVLDTQTPSQKLMWALVDTLNALAWPEYGGGATIQPDGVSLKCADGRFGAYAMAVSPDRPVTHVVFTDNTEESDIGVMNLTTLDEGTIVENAVAIQFCSYAQKRYVELLNGGWKV